MDMEKPLLSFIDCATEVLKANENRPMTSQEILVAIFASSLRLNSSSETPEQTLNAVLNRHSINATAQGTENFTKCIEIVSFDSPRRYRLINMSLKVESLIPDYKIYDVSLTQVKWYRYLCVHPNARNYHILIDMNEDPIRMYAQELQLILDKGLRTYDEAKLHLADKLEKKVISLRAKSD